MQWSANKAVKLIESWGQHGTICTLPLTENWLHQSSRQRTSLRARRGMRRPPARSGKKFYALDSLCFEVEEEQWYSRTATQSHPKSSKKQSSEGSIVKQHKDSRVFGMHANMQCKYSEAIKPKTSPSTSPIPPSSPSGTRFPHRFHNHQTTKMESALTALHAHRQDPKGQE